MHNSYKYEIALHLMDQGRYPMAIDLLKDLLARDPNDAAYHGALASCLLQQMRIHAAEYELKIALQLEPNNASLHCIAARIYYFQNKLKTALAACDEALQLDPTSADAFELKSDILIANKNFKEGFVYLQKMAELAPDSIHTAYSFAHYYFQTGDNAKAMEFTLAALAIDAQHEGANILMGRLQLIAGDIAEAEYHARLAIMLNPSSKHALQLFSDVKARQNIFIGFWWRFNAKISQLSTLNQVAILIFGYVLFNFLSILLYDLGHPNSSAVVNVAWLAIVAYSWFAMPVYQRMLSKEIEQFSFKADY